MIFLFIFLFSETLKEFKEFVISDAGIIKQLDSLRSEVEEFAEGFPMPGLADR